MSTFLSIVNVAIVCFDCSKYEPVIGAGASREQCLLSRDDAAQQSQQQQASDTFALEQLILPLHSTTAAALIPHQQVPAFSLRPGFYFVF